MLYSRLLRTVATVILLTILSTLCHAQGYISDASGCKVYTTTHTDIRSFSYKGSCKDGYVEGEATVIMFENGKQFSTTSGHFSKGKMNGQCTMQFSDGDEFTGQYVEGIRKQGVYKYANGARYEGGFDINGRSGKGVYYLAPRNTFYKYVGDFKNDAFNGDGAYYYEDGTVALKGQFANGLPNGKIEHVFKNGTRFNGTAVNAWWTGEATITFPEGAKYHGIFDQDISNSGTLTYNDGTVKAASFPQQCETMDEFCVKLNEAPRKGISDDSEFDEPNWKAEVADYRRKHQVKTGNMFIRNNLKGLTGILLYHSDNPNDIFAFSVVEEGEDATIRYDNKDITLGNDWFVRVYNEYKGRSERFFIGDVAKTVMKGYRIDCNEITFGNDYYRLAGNSFTSPEAAAEYLANNFFTTTKNKNGNKFVNVVGLEFTDFDYLLFVHGKGLVSEADIINKNEEATSALQPDDEKDAEEYGMKWKSITRFDISKQSTGDYYLTIYGDVENEDGQKKADRITLYVPAAKKEKIKNALDLLRQNQCTTLAEIARLAGIFDKHAKDNESGKKTSAQQKRKEYLQTRFSSTNDARNYLASNFSNAYTSNDKYYITISYSSSAITLTFKNYNATSGKIENTAAQKTIRWEDLASAKTRGWGLEDKVIKLNTRNNLAITPDNKPELWLYNEPEYNEKVGKVLDALEYMLTFSVK